MNISLVRTWKSDLSTIGVLSGLGELPIYTLERNEVIIPIGTFPIEITYSPRFNRPLPLLDSVPGRTDIRIHVGNWPRDTEGCILVGLQKGQDMILASEKALELILPQIQAALDSGDSITIEISDAAL